MTIQPPVPAPRFVLVHTNNRRQRHYFVALGEPWPGRSDRRMIAQTTEDRSKATVFETAPEALAVLALAGDPPSWTVEAA